MPDSGLPKISLSLLGTMIDQITDIDREGHNEYRWYEPWDTILNHIVQISPARNKLSVAPQYKVAREAFKSLDTVSLDPKKWKTLEDASIVASTSLDIEGLLDSGEWKPLEDASLIVNLGTESENDLSDSDQSHTSEIIQEIVREHRIPDFIVFHLDPNRRDVLLIVEIKPREEVDTLNKSAMAEAVSQATVQAQFVFEKFRGQNTVYALVAVGMEFCLLRFDDHTPHLPPYQMKHTGSSDEMPYDPIPPKKITRKRGKKGKVCIGERTTCKFSKGFKAAINDVMKSNNLGFPQWELLV